MGTNDIFINIVFLVTIEPFLVSWVLGNGTNFKVSSGQGEIALQAGDLELCYRLRSKGDTFVVCLVASAHRSICLAPPPQGPGGAN